MSFISLLLHFHSLIHSVSRSFIDVLFIHLFIQFEVKTTAHIQVLLLQPSTNMHCWMLGIKARTSSVCCCRFSSCLHYLVFADDLLFPFHALLFSLTIELLCLTLTITRCRALTLSGIQHLADSEWRPSEGGGGSNWEWDLGKSVWQFARKQQTAGCLRSLFAPHFQRERIYIISTDLFSTRFPFPAVRQ